MRRMPLVVALSLSLGTITIAPAQAAEGDTATLTVASTTDLHGYMRNFDYFTNEEFADSDGNTIGLANAAGAIEELRAERGEESVIVVDNGDLIQGSPLATYYAVNEPIDETGAQHPIADAVNAVGYDVLNIGNHEFNYGVDFLRAFEEQADAPVLGANVVDKATGEPAFQPYELVTRTLGDTDVTVGFLGLTTPGSLIWDKQHLADANLDILDMVQAADEWVPKMQAEGADIVVVVSHAGMNANAYDESGQPGAENPVNQIAEQVPGIDAIIIGHTHQEAPEQWITNAESGEEVLITQPYFWGRAVSDMTFDMVERDGEWVIEGKGAVLRYGKDVAPSQTVLDATQVGHDITVDYVNQTIATSVEDLPATESRYRDTAIIDYIQHVQMETVRESLAGGEYADLPVLSVASPFSRTAIFPEGDVTIRDMAGLYVYDNTLEAVLMTGAELKEYLEWSAKYFGQVEPGGEFDPETMTAVEYDGEPVADYKYDVIQGINYEINLSKPVGERIEHMTHRDGTPIADDEQFVLAVNNYRRSGGSDYPVISEAPIVHNDLLEIRQLLIDWALEREVIDPADFFERNWRLTIDGVPVFADDVIEGVPGDDGDDEPGDDPSTPADPDKPGLPSTGV